jgi:hypothetical protein
MQAIATAHCATRTGYGIDPRQPAETAFYDHEYTAPAAMAGDMVAALAATGYPAEAEIIGETDAETYTLHPGSVDSVGAVVSSTGERYERP